ncbi:tetratricopeptide repeat protein, partial [Candidatus Chloroploca sp. Khr17]|uniref:tetratricopeptide repeat protein n=1 Tax=Candidatus Chloroploca sp. Khr17 TaxID=2496869 RepID=UPI0013ECF050
MRQSELACRIDISLCAMTQKTGRTIVALVVVRCKLFFVQGSSIFAWSRFICQPVNTVFFAIGVTRNHIGRVYHSQGRLAQAMVELEATLCLFDTAIGREHPITACTLSNVGMLALETGAFADARRMLAEALAIHRRLLGAEHRHVARGVKCQLDLPPALPHVRCNLDKHRCLT